MAAALCLGNQDPLGLCAHYSRQQCNSEPDQAQMDQDCLAAALSAAMLVDWETINKRHEHPGRESAAQKAARRDEEAVQLLLHLHILALADPPAPSALAAGVCWVTGESAVHAI